MNFWIADSQFTGYIVCIEYYINQTKMKYLQSALLMASHHLLTLESTILFCSTSNASHWLESTILSHFEAQTHWLGFPCYWWADRRAAATGPGEISTQQCATHVDRGGLAVDGLVGLQRRSSLQCESHLGARSAQHSHLRRHQLTNVDHDGCYCVQKAVCHWRRARDDDGPCYHHPCCW